MTAPVFPLPWRALRDKWVQMIAGQPRIVPLGEALEGRRLSYIQHSLLFRFPDVVTVEFVPLGPDQSSLAHLQPLALRPLRFPAKPQASRNLAGRFGKARNMIPTQSGA